MATEVNPYDQFDESTSPAATPLPAGTMPGTITIRPSASDNPYDQFDEVDHHKAGVEQGGSHAGSSNAPKKMYHWWEALQQAYKNSPADAARMMKEIWHAVSHPVEAGTALGHLVGGGYLAASDALGGKTPETHAPWAIEAERGAVGTAAHELGKVFSDAGEPWGSAIKRTVAETPVEAALDVAPIAGPLAGRAVGAVAGPTAGRVASAVVNPLGAVNDAATAVNTRVIPKVSNKLADVVNPSAALVSRAGETPGRLNQLNAALENPRQIVPNSPVTARDAIADVNAPFMQNLMKQGEDANAAVTMDTNAAKEAAQGRQIDMLGGTGQVTAQSRQAHATQNYARADARGVRADPEMMTLWESPSTRAAFDVAQAIVREERAHFPDAPHTPARHAPDPYGQNFPGSGTDIPEQWATYTGEDMGRIKKAFDRLAFEPELRAKYNIQNLSADAIQRTRHQFIDWMERRNPNHRIAREGFQAESGPVREGEIGQYFRQKFDDGNDLASLFDSPLNEANGNPVVKAATGREDFNHLRDAIGPRSLRNLESVRDELARTAGTEAQATAGGEFGGSLDRAVSDALGVSQSNKLLNYLLKGANKNVGSRVGRQILTPEGARELVRNALAHEAGKDWWGINHEAATRLNNLANPYGYANRFPALYDMLNQQTTNEQQGR